MSTAATARRRSHVPGAVSEMANRVELAQLKVELEGMHQEYRTRTYTDKPVFRVELPTEEWPSGDSNAAVVVAMESGRVWKFEPGNREWSTFGPPLPDTPAREAWDEIVSITKAIADISKQLGIEEED